MNSKDIWNIFETELKSGAGAGAGAAAAAAPPDDGHCAHCKTILIITDEGFPTCTNPKCGFIYKDVLDSSPEWRYSSGADDKNNVDMSRSGNPINPLLQESSFGCKIVCGKGSPYELKKIRRYTEWMSMPHREKSLYSEFQFITIMAQNAGIPRVLIDDAMIHHKNISEQKMFRGMNRDGIKAASIYIACRLNGFPRTAQEIATIFHLDKTSASTGCSMAVNLLHNAERGVEHSQQTELCISLPSNFIERFCSKLEMHCELTYLAKFIAEKIERDGLLPDDNTPQSIAAGIIYFIVRLAKLSITKTQIREVCSVSEVTINKCAKKIEKIQDNVVPQVVLHKWGGASAPPPTPPR
jgi:transcription initiation factor TFIIB